MKILSGAELENLCLGSALLGSGGGGDTAILKGYVQYLLEKHGAVTLLSPDELTADSLVIPLALIGAPLVSLERIPNRKMFTSLLTAIRQDYPNRKLVLMPAEIGGCNALTPFVLAATEGMPLLDADLIGRAFPKINMCKPAVLNQCKQKVYLSSVLGECLQYEVETIASLEEKARDAAMQFGSSAAIATFIFESPEQDNYIIPGSLSRAMELGALLKEQGDLARFANLTAAKRIASGIVTEVKYSIQGGFLMGYANVQGEDKNYRIYFQNEYLCVESELTLIAESPTIISLIETRSHKPVASESLRYGLHVNILALQAPFFWEQEKARKQVSLDVFDLQLEGVMSDV